MEIKWRTADMEFSLGKDKKLKSRKKIERLFESGKRIRKFPLNAVYFFEENSEPGFQIAVSVPKKHFKKAVDRNLIKRRMREAFRLNQHQLKTNRKLEVMFIYSTPEIRDYATIEKAVIFLIAALNDDSSSGKST